MDGHKYAYDDEEMVELIAEGQMTYAQIAAKLGVSESLVKKVARGARRRELLRRIWDVEDGMLSESRRMGSKYARNLMMEQVRLGLSGEGEPARRAREFVLKFAASTRGKRSDLPAPLPPPWMQRVKRDMEELFAAGIQNLFPALPDPADPAAPDDPAGEPLTASH